MLTIEKLDLFYGDAQALDDVSLEVPQGEVVAIVGANGAGKSSLIRTIAGIEKARAGTIAFKGRRIDGLESHDICDLGIGQVAEGRQVFPTLTVQENLEMGALLPRARKLAQRALAEVYELFPRLAERREQLAGTMSGGEQQMLAMGRALMSRPKVLLMDEPSMGLSPIMVDKIFEVVREVYAQGVTILLVEQNASRALQLADRAYVMESGLITMSGDAKQLLSDPKVRAAYLGE